MYIVQGVLVSDLIFEKQFVCHLDKCKGACCHEGDFGAPLTQKEIENIKEYKLDITDYLSFDQKARIERKGVSTTYVAGKRSFQGTSLMPSGACVYMNKDKTGCAKCALEVAHSDNVIPFQKPISCHLYPLRIVEDDGFVAINYDEWDICNAACTLGKSLKIPVFRFVKNALIRRFGFEFYAELEQAYEQWLQSTT